MAILVLKKVPVRADIWRTKFLIGLIYLFLSSYDAYAQKLEGTYLREFSDGSSQFKFLENSFEETIVGDVGDSYGKGTFTCINNKLSLIYKAILTDRDSSSYLLEAIPGSLPVPVLSFKILGEDKKPLTGMITLTDINGIPLLAFEADINGTGSLRLLEKNAFGYISIEYKGYNAAIIPCSSLHPLEYKIRVELNPGRKYYIEPKTKNFNVFSSTSKKLVLIDEEEIKFTYRKK